jgi:hypothetical protein
MYGQCRFAVVTFMRVRFLQNIICYCTNTKFMQTFIKKNPPPPEVSPTLAQWRDLCGQMMPRAMLAVAYATGRVSHARQVKGDDPD